MNEVSFRRVIAPELHRRGRGPATFGERTEEQPSFPLLGAILRLPPHRHSRDLFSVIGVCVTNFFSLNLTSYVLSFSL